MILTFVSYGHLSFYDTSVRYELASPAGPEPMPIGITHLYNWNFIEQVQVR